MTVVLGDISRDEQKYRLTLSENVNVFDSVSSLVAYVDDHDTEDLVIVGADAPMMAATEIAEKYRLDRPPLGVVLVRNRVEVQTMAEALRAGIREVVAADDAQSLVEACHRSQSVSHEIRHGSRRAGDSSMGKLIVVFSAKGGCGKTTLSTNLAEALAAMNVGKVCLVDFNLDFGDVAIALQIEPVRTISNALGMQGGLDKQGVESLVIHYKDNFDVLLAPTQPADAEFISPALTAEILGLLAEAYQFVVIDTPAAFNDVVLKCFDLCDSYILLSTLDMLALKNFKVTLDTLEALGYPKSRWQIVLNRFDSRVGLSAEDVERTTGVHIVTKLPSSKDVPASLNRGMTLVAENAHHPFSRAVEELATIEANGLGAAAQPALKKHHLFLRGGGA